MKQCMLEECTNEAKGKYCSQACSNRGRKRTRKCADGISLCTNDQCDCGGRKLRMCIVCSEPRGRYSVKYCNDPKCKTVKAARDPELVEAWLRNEYNASAPAGAGKCTLAAWARSYMIREANEQCTVCGWNEPHEDTGRPPLEVDHIDGNRCNCYKNNLKVLCPNHHALTRTYRRHNYKRVQELKRDDPDFR